MKQNSLTWAKEEVFEQLSSDIQGVPSNILHHVIDCLFSKESGKEYWRRGELCCSFGLVYAMAAMWAPKSQNLDWKEYSSLLKYVQTLDQKLYLSQMELVCGSLDVPDMQLIQYIAHDFFRGNEAPMKKFLKESVSEAAASEMRRDALYAVRDISLLCLYSSNIESMDTAEKIKGRSSSGELGSLPDKFSALPHPFLLDDVSDLMQTSSSMSPMTLGWTKNLKRQPKSFRLIGENLTRTLPENVLLGCIMLYLDRDPLAFTSAFFKSFLSETYHVPVFDPRVGVHLRELDDDGLFNDGNIDLFSGAFQVTCLNEVMESLTADEMKELSDRFETVFMNPAQVIAFVSRCPVYFNVPFSKSLERWFVAHGASESEAHDFSVIAGTLYSTHNRMLPPVTVDEGPEASELAQLKKQLEAARNQIDSLQKKGQERPGRVLQVQ